LKPNQQIPQIAAPTYERAPDGAGAELSEKLDRILQVVEKQQQPGVLELALVIILALTALGSTWCAYQSQLWNGVQLARLTDAEIATQEAQGNTLAGLQRRTQDGLLTLHFMEAIRRNDTKSLEAMRRRMPSPLREAMEASLALDPLNNPDVPGPMKMPQYVLIEEQQAEKARARALELRTGAQQAGQYGDSYVLLTLMFASVLFFGGITGTFQSRRLRLGMGCIALVLFVVTTIRVVFMPVCA
jgi:hypothetical protein